MLIPHGRRNLASITGFVVLTILIGYSGLHLLVSPLADFFPPPLSPSSSSSSSPPASYHNYTSAFSFDLNETVHRDWMSHLPDSIYVNSLSIPGTHDTLTFNLTDNVVFQCQNHDLATQLRAGLRYFDIRGRLLVDAAFAQADPVIGIFHGHVYTGYTFQDVLLTLFQFLDDNPSEGIVLRVKEEGTPVYQGDPSDEWQTGQYNTTFEQAFNHYRTNNTLTAPGSAHHFLLPWPALGGSSDHVMPTMAQLRGRVLVLYEFPVGELSYGIPWDTAPYMRLEDLWVIADPAHLDDKWDAVRQNLELAGASDDDGDVLFLSHLSASVGVTPIEAAAGPFTKRENGSVIVGINDRTGLWLEEGAAQKEGSAGKTGIIMADFPGQRLVNAILARNDWLIMGG